MAAPGGKEAGSREGTFCERCFAPVGKGEAYCPDCGAPVGEDAPVADSAVHGELAQANLLRLRGEYDAAEKALLAVLRRFPNDPHAHEMLGDVCADRGEGERAIEWYELALDLSPNAPGVRRKLDEVRERLEARTTADTAEQIGLPPTTPPAAWWPLAASGAILLLAIVVAAWPRAPLPPTRTATVVASEPPVQTVASNENAAPETTPSPVTSTGVESDRRLLADLQKLPDGARVQSVVADPRGTVAVTFEVSASDDAKAVALAVGKAALGAAPNASSATLRAVRAGELVLTADLARATMDAAEPLTNVWPPRESTPGASTPSVEPSLGSGTASGTGTTAGASAAGSTGTGSATSGSTTAGSVANGTETSAGTASPAAPVPGHGTP